MPTISRTEWCYAHFLFFFLLISAIPGTIRIAYAEEQAVGNADDRKVLRSASEFDYPPFAIVGADGTADGFSVDLLKAATEAAGLSVTFKIGPWHQLKEELASGTLDVLPLVSYSPERDRIYDFTTPYLRMNGTVFVRKGDPNIRSLTDLKGREVLVMEGDTAHEYALREKLSEKIIPTATYEEAFRRLASGRHDAVVVQQIVGLQIIRKLHLANIVPVSQKHVTTLKPVALKLEGFEQKFCFAVREGNQPLVAQLNEGLTIVYLNGTYNTLYEKWFAPILPKPEISMAEIIRQVLVVLVPLLLVLTLAGLWYLRRLVRERTQVLEIEIEQRQKTEEALAEANTRYEDAQKLGKVGNWVFVPATGELWASAEARRIFGFTDGIHLSLDAVQQCFADRRMAEKAMQEMLSADRVDNLECGIITANEKKHRTILLLARTENDDAGRPVRLTGVIQDVTERKRMEERLQQAHKLEAVGVLAGGIAHDFNNILTSILGFAELIRDSYPGDRQLQEDIGEIYTAASRAKELVQQIQTFSRREKTKPYPLRVELVIKETMRLMRATLPASIEIRVDVAETMRPVLADPTHLHQIVMNICTNAAQAMEEGGILTVRAFEATPADQVFLQHPDLARGRYVQFEVHDTGRGIGPERIGSIFDPYFTTREFGDGTGLGLAVTYGLVREMNGEILVWSEEGTGSVFTVLLPIVEAGEELSAGFPAPSDQPLMGGRHVLLVDDEPPILKMTTRMLERGGYTVSPVQDGVAALERFRKDPAVFDLVISDISMPGLTGDRLAREMLAIRPDLPILLTSGHAGNVSEEAAELAGARGFLQKPVTEKQLFGHIRQIFASPVDSDAVQCD